MDPREDVTKLLADVNAGKVGAEEALLPILYDELRAIAHRYMRDERSDHTLQTTALVHEAYLRLGGERESSWENRAHYMRVAARAMRRVLIDHARRKKSDKHGGGWLIETLDRSAEIMEEASFDLIDLDGALTRLGEIDQQMVQVVECRFFAGLTVQETARVMGISESTVKRDWLVAKAWLKHHV